VRHGATVALFGRQRRRGARHGRQVGRAERALRAFQPGRSRGTLDLWSDDFVWEGSNASELPGSGRHEGKQAAIEVLQQAVGEWDKFELSADEFVEQGDTVVVLGHTDLAKGERSERLPVVHIWRYRGDEEICRLQILTDTLQSARILGIA
jgi:ketosteroid isomerase-like protein